MPKTDTVTSSLDKLSLESDSDAGLDTLYSDPKSFSVDEAKKILSKVKAEVLKEKVNNEIHGTIQVMKYISMVDFATKNINEQAKQEYMNALKLEIKAKGADEAFLKLIHLFILSISFNLKDFEPLISSIIPYIETSDAVFLTIVTIFSRFKDQTHPFLEEQLEILTIEENAVASFKLMSLLFSIDTTFAVKMFNMPSFQNLLTKINQNNSTTPLKVIKASLYLLSSACVDPNLRSFISEKYLDTLVFALKYVQENSVQTLAGLVILKTWNFETLASKDVKIDDLCDLFVENLDSESIEGLSYISLKKSSRIRLRKDEALLFDLIAKLQDDEDKSPKYGILSIIANLSNIEEKDKLSDLKKQAQKNLEDSIEEDEDEIKEYCTDLVERRVIEIISKLVQTKHISEQCIRLIYNISRVASLQVETVKQGGLHLLMKLLAGTESVETRNTGLKALSLIIHKSNPNLLFNKDSPKTAFNYLFNILIDEESFSQKDQYLALLSLTNLALLESIGALSPKQWEVIDSFLLDNNPHLRRGSLEFIANLMQHKSNLVALFNFENSSSKKRFEVVVKYTQLEDVKSQSAALTSLTFGITIPFICEEIVKNSSVVEYCSTITKEQSSQIELIERAVFILYYITNYSEQSDGSVLKQLQDDNRLKNSLINMTKNKKHDPETIEMIQELSQLIRFK